VVVQDGLRDQQGKGVSCLHRHWHCEGDPATWPLGVPAGLMVWVSMHRMSIRAEE
jgi:hypothetical protein